MMTENNTAAPQGARAGDINNVLYATDVITDARCLIECILLAASSLEQDSEAFSTVASIAIDKLLEARNTLKNYRAAQNGGAA